MFCYLHKRKKRKQVCCVGSFFLVALIIPTSKLLCTRRGWLNQSKCIMYHAHKKDISISTAVNCTLYWPSIFTTIYNSSKSFTSSREEKINTRYYFFEEKRKEGRKERELRVLIQVVMGHHNFQVLCFLQASIFFLWRAIIIFFFGQVCVESDVMREIRKTSE